MFLRSKIRRKDGKDHRAWSVVENRRVHDGRVVQRQVLYLGEINDCQRAAWSKAIEVLRRPRWPLFCGISCDWTSFGWQRCRPHTFHYMS
jgi:hypothetical protein